MERVPRPQPVGASLGADGRIRWGTPCDQLCNLEREITIPKGHYFMMGDNRGASADSREWGPVPKKWMIGKAFLTYWPPGKIGTL